jgi:phage host-nuclease inhibitor protein Gam
MSANAEKLVAAYIKIRDAKAALEEEYEAKLAKLNTDMEAIESALLELCKVNGQDGGKTKHGSFTRTVTTRYWTNDWHNMRQFIKEHDALDLMEQRIHQSNMKEFLKANPDARPPGLNADARWRITVRRATTKPE